MRPGASSLLCDHALTAYFDEVAYPAQEADGEAGRAPGAAGDLARPARGQLDAEELARAVDDGLELLLAVELEAGDDAEAVAQRPGDEPSPSRRADEGEARQVEADRARRRAAPEDDVELEVLHGRIKQFLNRAAHAVDLVDEQDVARLEVGQDGGHVAAAHERRPGGDPQTGPHLEGQ